MLAVGFVCGGPAAAQLDPAAAAARLPGISRPDLLLLMDTGAAAARLRAMTPAAAAQRLDFLPLQAAASLLTRLDPDYAVQAMAQMRRWDPSRLLPPMLPETAACLRMLLRSHLASADRHHLDTPPLGQ